jgi:hypothetical protein
MVVSTGLKILYKNSYIESTSMIFTFLISCTQSPPLVCRNVTFFFFHGLGFELRTLWLQSRYSTTWTTSPVHFSLVVLEMGSHKLFAWTGLQPLPSSASQVSRITSVSHWWPATCPFQQIWDFHLNTAIKHIHFYLTFWAPFAFWEADFHKMKGKKNIQ